MPDDEDALPGDTDPAEEPQPTPAAGDAALVTRMSGIETALVELAHRIQDDSERAAARERVIDRQHQDIERLRSVERVGAMRPVITDLCRLRNDLLRQAARLTTDLTAEQGASLLASFADSVEEALLRCGVQVLPQAVGDRFTPERQQVARVVEIDDPDRDGTVAEIVHDGYAEIDGGRVVMAGRVAVHRAAPDGNAAKER